MEQVISKKYHIEKNTVQETLIIPLYGSGYLKEWAMARCFMSILRSMPKDW